MIPSVLSQQLQRGIEDFLRTTFPVYTPFFHGLIDRLLAEDGGVFKGPYLSIQLPFRPGSSGPDFFPDVPLAFRPYLHQEQAFRRLGGPRPRSTLVATGTGSGKTESFLYPILDHCYRHRGEPGIKAILLYPMNNLAMDQAGRLARAIWNNPRLKGHVTAGLLVGQSEKEPRRVMGPDGILIDRETQRLSPPDILLTNYKMLDYLLIRPWDPNLLSCTPTLEMGIDIGDLSSLILCSVPPAQAHYLQRIGRAGRRDGNALNLTVANGRPHDLYFFAERAEMIAGRIDPPGVFLNASAVLERQFTAFCFDRWVESGIGAAALPGQLGQVLNSLEPAGAHKFPHNFLRFIESRQTDLFDRFVALFAEALTAESVAHLQRFVEGDRERESLRKKVRTLHDRVHRKEEDPVRDQNYEKELRELKLEKAALHALIGRINARDTLNFFTDEGLLPNYAFPDAGVLLRSVIYRRRELPEEGEGHDQPQIYEYERLAVSAIDELAPANHFYAGGRKVQVDMAVSEIETWQFCNTCSHPESSSGQALELVGREEEKSVCPRCGSPLWSDAGQKRPMLRLRQVFATTPDRDSRIGDDRDLSFYHKQMLVALEECYITEAYRLEGDELPFGFELLSRVTFREINFGEKGVMGERVAIAGVELPRKGFTLCRHCGKVQNARGEIRHALTCTARDPESGKSFADCLYLYREFSSEAIRMLLPVTTFSGSARALHSFVAALQLGLKRKFRGKIDHLQTTFYEEPVPELAYRKRYLLLYDTVPGGTGYLKELMRSERPLLDALELSLELLRSPAPATGIRAGTAATTVSTPTGTATRWRTLHGRPPSSCSRRSSGTGSGWSARIRCAMSRSMPCSTASWRCASSRPCGARVRQVLRRRGLADSPNTAGHGPGAHQQVPGRSHLARYLRQVEGEGDTLKEVCLVARTNDLLKQYESALGERGLETYFIRRSEPEDRRTPGGTPGDHAPGQRPGV